MESGSRNSVLSPGTASRDGLPNSSLPDQVLGHRSRHSYQLLAAMEARKLHRILSAERAMLLSDGISLSRFETAREIANAVVGVGFTSRRRITDLHAHAAELESYIPLPGASGLLPGSSGRTHLKACAWIAMGGDHRRNVLLTLPHPHVSAHGVMEAFSKFPDA